MKIVVNFNPLIYYIFFFLIENSKEGKEKHINQRKMFQKMKSYKFLRKNEEIDYFNNLEDCFKCNSANNNIYENNICKTLNVSLNWYEKLSKCNDKNSFIISDNFCGELEEKSNKISLINSNLQGKNDNLNVFCSWEITKGNYKKIILKIKNNNDKSKLGFMTISKKEKGIFENINYLNTFKKSFSSFEKIIIYYYNSYLPKENPFILEIKIKNPISFNQISFYLIIIVSVIVIIIFIIILFSLCLKIKDNNQNENIERHFKVVLYSKNLSFNEICPICLDNFRINNYFTILSCKHGFHIECIKKWIDGNFKKNNFCPICHNKIDFNKKDLKVHILIHNTNNNILVSSENNVENH